MYRLTHKITSFKTESYIGHYFAIISARQTPSKKCTSAWSGIDTLANCNKVEHDKIRKCNEILAQERKFFEKL